MSLLLTSLLSALVPVGVEGVKQVITNYVGGVKPTSVAEQIQLDEQEIKRLQAVAALDNPGGTPSQWVIDLRASTRYIAAIGIILAGICAVYAPDVDTTIRALAIEAANVAFGFLFGQRIVANFQGKK